VDTCFGDDKVEGRCSLERCQQSCIAANNALNSPDSSGCSGSSCDECKGVEYSMADSKPYNCDFLRGTASTLSHWTSVFSSSGTYDAYAVNCFHTMAGVDPTPPTPSPPPPPPPTPYADPPPVHSSHGVY
jgi:hypothetical protein